MMVHWSCVILVVLLAMSVPCRSSTTESHLTTSRGTDGLTEGATSTDSLETKSTEDPRVTATDEGRTDASTIEPGTDGATRDTDGPTRGTDGATRGTDGPTRVTTDGPTRGTDGATRGTDGPTRATTDGPTRGTDGPTRATTDGPTRGTDGPTQSTDGPTRVTGGPTRVTDGTTRVTDGDTPGTRSEGTTQSPPGTPRPEISYSVPTPYGTIAGITYTVTIFPAGAPSEDSGEDESFANTKKVSKFLGIPYAEPPTGSLRFKPPVKVPSKNRTATAFKPNCPQKGPAPFSEDCLYYNIWTVQTLENANSSVTYPVLVWFHGGRFEVGGSDDRLKEGEELVTHEDTVVVTFNYRLGALGFLTLNKSAYTGNYGIQDQRLALQVIYDVIPSFGGNRAQIALMGLDAGAASIGFHMMSADTSKLFSRVIMMGGSPMMPWSLTNDLEYVQLLSHLFTVGGLKCQVGNDAQLSQCLQTVPLDRLISLQNNFTRFFQGLEFFPIIDGSIIPQDPWHAFSTGNFNGKEVLIGATNDEGANIAEDGLEARGVPVHGVNDSMLLDLIERSIMFYPRASQVLSSNGLQFLRFHFSRYAGANDGKANFDTLGKAIGDWYLTCPVMQMAQFAEKRSSNVYLYYFTEKEINQDKWDGASHGEDANYAFGVPTLSSGISYPPEKKRLSERIMGHLVQFARSGKPASEDLWKPLNASGNELNYIDYNSDARILGNKKRGFRLAECRFWNETLAYVNNLVRPETTTSPGTTGRQMTTSNPIGPVPTCGGDWEVNKATATTLGVLLGTQTLFAGALAFVIYKWKTLARVGAEALPMN